MKEYRVYYWVGTNTLEKEKLINALAKEAWRLVFVENNEYYFERDLGTCFCCECHAELYIENDEWVCPNKNYEHIFKEKL